MTATVTTLKTTKPATKRTRNTSAKRIPRTTTLNTRLGYVAGAVACTLTAVSITHLSEGIARLMSVPGWQAWALACTIDAGFICAELAMVLPDERTLAAARPYAKPIVIATLIMSAYLNGIVMQGGRAGFALVPVWIAACVIPALVYGFSRLSAKLLNCASK